MLLFGYFLFASVSDGCASREGGYSSFGEEAETGQCELSLGEKCRLNHWPGYKLMWEYLPYHPYPNFSSSPGAFNHCQTQTMCTLNHLRSKEVAHMSSKMVLFSAGRRR